MPLLRRIVTVVRGAFKKLGPDFLFDATRLAQTTKVARDGIAYYFDQSGMLRQSNANRIRNSAMAGPGKPNLPTNWSIATNSGVTTTVLGYGTEDGLPYMDLRIHGKATSNNSVQIFPDSGSGLPVAAAGEVWSASFNVKLLQVSEAGYGSQPSLVVQGRTAGGGWNNADQYQGITPSTSGALKGARFYNHGRTLANGTAATGTVGMALIFWQAINTTYDFTLRIAAPQLEKAAKSSEIALTDGTAGIASPRFFTDASGAYLPLIESQATNHVRNSQGTGGTTSTLPTHWATSFTSGLTPTVVDKGTDAETGLPYYDIRVAGTIAATGRVVVYFDTYLDAAQGQQWCLSYFSKPMSGTVGMISGLLGYMDEGPGGSGWSNSTNLTQDGLSMPTTSDKFSTCRRSGTYAVTSDAAMAAAGKAPVKQIRPALRVNVTAGTCDFVVRVAQPQLERGAVPTSPILTYGAAATRLGDTATVKYATPAGLTFTRGADKAYAFDRNGYLAEYTTNEMRLEYDPANGNVLGLLMEEQRVNHVRNSVAVGGQVGGVLDTNADSPANAAAVLPTNWGAYNPQRLTITFVERGIEDGIEYVDIRLTGTVPATGNLQTGIYFDVQNSIGASDGQQWATSVFLKRVAGSNTGITTVNVGYDEYSGTAEATTWTSSKQAASLLTALSDDASKRLGACRRLHAAAAQGQYAGATTFVRPRVNIQGTASGVVDITLRMGLPQIELGAFATSVIKTSGTVATRTVEACYSNLGSVISEATLYVEAMSYTPTSVTRDNFALVLSDNTSNNRLAINRYTMAPSTSMLTYRYAVDGSAAPVLAPNITPWSAGVMVKAAVSAKAGKHSSSLNGSDGASVDTTVGIPSNLSYITIGTSGSNTQTFNGHIKRVEIYRTYRDHTQLKEMTK